MTMADTERTTRRAADPVRHISRVVLPYVLLLLCAVLLLRDAAIPLNNGDTYFHLRFGHEFLSGDWSLWHPGHPTSFESARWVPTQWLPEIVMAAIEKALGLAGVAWLYGLLSIALLLTWHGIARRHSEPIVAALLTTVAITAAAPGISMRPQVLSFIAAALTTDAWLSTARTGRRPWWLIAMTWLWAMCHGMWPLGIAIGCAAVIGISLDQGWRAGRRMLPIPVLQAVAAALTPVGPMLYPAVIKVNGDRAYFTEWASPDFSTLAPLMGLLILVVAVILLARARRARALDVVLTLAALGGLVYSERTIPIAVAVLVPLVARLATQTRPFRNRPDELGSRPNRRRESIALLAGAAIGLSALALVVPHTASKQGMTPAWVDTALAGLPAGTPVLDDSRLGGYLLWAHPQLDPYEHGYGDVYTRPQLDRIVMVNRAQAGWLTDVRASGARVALLTPTSTLDEALRQQGWRVAQTGGGWDYLTAPANWTEGTRSPRPVR